MATKYKRTLAQRRRAWERDLGWWWDKNCEGVYAGFMVATFSFIIAVYLLWGM